jgi:hypothetical protein
MPQAGGVDEPESVVMDNNGVFDGIAGGAGDF